jgi:hypothetical protein
MVRLEEYEDRNESEWNEFVTRSKNATFLFDRGYMDYHSDRFNDASFLVYDEDDLVGMIPGNISGSTYYSHQGLTYGGVLCDVEMTAELMIDIFNRWTSRLTEQGLDNIVYRAIPHIYHTIPAEEDLYALFRKDAQLVQREVSSAINLNEPVEFRDGREWAADKGRREGVTVEQTDDFRRFIEIETELLKERYDEEPTHTPDEMELLAGRFPDNIKLFASSSEGNLISGVLVYETENVAHTQYIADTDKGRDLHASDVILDYLINEYYTEKQYFDFGISTEDGGNYLNEGLVFFKEGFGARSVVYDTYELTLG